MKKQIILSDKLLKMYIQYLHEQEKSQSTINSYKRELFSLQMYIDQYPLTKEKLIAYKAILTNQYTPSTCNVAIAAINSFLRFVGREDLAIKPLRVQKQIFENQDKELSKKDYNKLVRAAIINGDERTALAIQTICATGIRVSELKYITTESLKNGQAHVYNKGKNRVIFIPKSLIQMLKKYVINHNIASGPIFVTRNNKPLDRSNLWKSMKQLCSVAGVKPSKVCPHNLRHLFARTYHEQQKDIGRLADILGHSNINTTRIYTRESETVFAKQIEGLNLVGKTT